MPYMRISRDHKVIVDALEAPTGDALAGPGGAGSIEEDFVLGPNAEKLARVPGHIACRFARNCYLG